MTEAKVVKRPQNWDSISRFKCVWKVYNVGLVLSTPTSSLWENENRARDDARWSHGRCPSIYVRPGRNTTFIPLAEMHENETLFNATRSRVATCFIENKSKTYLGRSIHTHTRHLRRMPFCTKKRNSPDLRASQAGRHGTSFKITVEVNGRR